MSRAVELLRAFVLAGLVCVGVIALVIFITLWISGRPFAPFIHMVLDLGLLACVVLLGGIVIVYPLMTLAVPSLGARSQGWVVVQGALVGITAFIARYILWRDGGDPETISAYLAFLRRSPWEIVGLLPFVLGGITFALLAQRARRQASEAARR
jgi:hypothetical protein